MTFVSFFFFNDTATTESYTYGHTLSLHDALPISSAQGLMVWLNEEQKQAIEVALSALGVYQHAFANYQEVHKRSEEHTSELQSLMRISYAVFCLKKKKKIYNTTFHRPYRISIAKHCQ